MSRLLPSWIQAYLAYTDTSMSPEEYHKWCAISTIAGAMRRKVFFQYNHFPVYANGFVILVGPAGRCKKSTAMRICREILDQVPGVSFTTDSITRERLIQDLSQVFADGHSSMTAFSSEFATLLTSSGMDMVVFLTDIYDSPLEWSHKTKMGGTNKIKAPCLNLLGATTPEWMAKAMPLDTVGIGLTSRVVFVYQDTPRPRKAFAKLTEAQKKLRDLLIKDLTAISLLSGEYKLTQEAEDFYEEWHLAISTPEASIDRDPRLAGYFERKPVHVVKLAMVIAASAGDALILEQEHIAMAIEELNLIEPLMAKAFANVGKNPLNVDIEETLATILSGAADGVSFGELLVRFKHSVRKEEMAEVLETLTAMGYIRIVPDPNRGPVYYPKEGR